MIRKRKKRKIPANPNTQSVSVHDHLSGALGIILASAKFPRRQTKEVLTSLIGLVANYREEGQQLFPEVFLFEHLEEILKSLPNSERVIIGLGPQTPSTLGLAIKRCAPLAQFGWSIYVCRRKTSFEYGLLRSGLTALSISAPEQLIDEGDEDLPAIMIRQVSSHTIEVSGPNRCRLRVLFGAAERGGQDPFVETRKFCDSIVRQVRPGLTEQVGRFYWRIFDRVLKSGHGCLAVVLKSKKRTLPKRLRDGVLIQPALDVAGRVSAVLEEKGNACGHDTRLRATAALIRGMLLVDGVTVFRSDGSAMAYNVFVKDSRNLTTGVVTFGGARRRAFQALCGHIGTELESVFFLSQDGHAEFRGSKK